MAITQDMIRSFILPCWERIITKLVNEDSDVLKKDAMRFIELYDEHLRRCRQAFLKKQLHGDVKSINSAFVEQVLSDCHYFYNAMRAFQKRSQYVRNELVLKPAKHLLAKVSSLCLGKIKRD